MCSITVPSTGTSRMDTVTFITRTSEKFSTDVRCTSSPTAAWKRVSHGVRHQLCAVNVHVGFSSRHRTGRQRFTLGRSASLWHTAPNNAPLMHTCMGDKSKKTCEHGSLSHHHPSLPRSCIGMVQECRLVHCELEKGRGKTRKKNRLSPSCIAPQSHVPCTTVFSASSSWSLKWFVICYYMVYGRQTKGLSPDLIFFFMKLYLHCNIGMGSGLGRSWSLLLKPEAAATSLENLPCAAWAVASQKSHC